MERSYRICTRCIMDTSDPDIVFDGQGVCNHCRNYDLQSPRELIAEADRERRLGELVAEIRRRGTRREYDCVIGLSGGVDSSYVAYQTKRLGLRPLAVHLDNGWDSELAVKNIEQIVKRLDIDLHTHVIDWEEFRDLQRAFFRASVIDIELLTDHAIFAAVYGTARRFGIGFFLSGYNYATENVMPRTWYFGNKLDSRNIRSIYRACGSGRPLRTFPILSAFDILRYGIAQTIRTVPLLNYLHYRKLDAVEVLQRELGWVNYGGKHYESRFTQFYQAYILPRKFGVDKRRAHLSSLIYAGELTRDAALERMRGDLYSEERAREDRAFFLKKLGFTDEEFDAYLAAPPRPHYDFASYDRWYRKMTGVLRCCRP